jgi:RNA-directed DNA polymerase
LTIPHVVVTDIAHYYATMNLELLSQELVDRTGQWEVVRSIEQLLRAFSPRTGGLPQGNRTSDRLADTYTEMLGHRLTRAGIECWWYADDFRIAASDYSAAVHALDVLDRECRQMGLFINERKTRISSRARYEELQNEPATAFTQAWEDKREELSVFDPYATEAILPDDAEVIAGVALDELEAWSGRVDDFIRDPGREASARLDLGFVLALLTVGKEGAGLRHVPDLLRVEPQHTPLACKYLGGMLRQGAPEAWTAAAHAIQVDSLTDWQRLWLLDAFSLSIPDGFPWEPQSKVREWSVKMHGAANEILRTHAVWVTAQQGQLTKAHWEAAVRHATPYGQQTLAAASALVPDLPATALYTDVLSRSLHAWAKGQYVEDE